MFGVDLGQDDPELVTAQPCQDVGLADPAPKRRGDRLEQVVAGFVAEPVVDVFEMIQIDQQDGPAAAIAGRRLGLLGQRLLEAPAVEQCRQKIVIDEVFQTPLELLALGDVLHLRDEMQREAVVVADERDVQQHPHRVAPGMLVSLLDLIRRDAPVEQLQILSRVDVDVVRIRQVAERAGAQLLGRIPGDPAQRVVHSQHPAGHVHQGHADRRVRERIFKSATHRHPPIAGHEHNSGLMISVA